MSIEIHLRSFEAKTSSVAWHGKWSPEKIFFFKVSMYVCMYVCMYLFIYLFIYGCVGSSFLCQGFL